MDLLVNGDFESGSLSPWQSIGAVGLTSGHGSAFGVWMVAQGTASARLWQAVGLPAQANPASLSFWWLAESEVEQPNDRLVVFALHEGGPTALRVLYAVSPLGQWQHETIDLTAYAGSLQGISFIASGDAGQPTTFRLDDIHLLACGVSTHTPTATPTPTGTITPPSNLIYLPLVLKAYAPETELAYDDGEMDTNTSWETGKGFAVRFTPPGTQAQLLRARYYLLDPRAIEVHVWDENHTDLITPFTANTDQDGWNDADLSAYNVTVSGDFYVGFLHLEDYRPTLGIDTTSADGCSFEVDGEYWEQQVSDYMIRAVVVDK